MFLFILIVQTLVAIALISVILMQRSEGGGFAGGGSPSGMMSARGAADFLTRATTILGTIFISLSILLAALAAQQAGPRVIDANAVRPAQQPAPAEKAPDVPATPAPAPAAPANQQGGVPIAQ